ncbi:hypothetical protein PT974_01517 [Cladobotryum mycophilum]|uniref:Serine hydrolase domain-containing protein n=1 Tax=Cladobotryum mycophilum TaxID=491253 RepID=A0ABR0T3T9_9HYPO
MKVLCLHGAFGNASNFQVQLGPFIGTIEKNSKVEFKWINGFTNATPPEGFENYFGNPPLYRFMGYDGISKLDETIVKMRELVQESTPEDTMRTLLAEQDTVAAPAVKSAISKLIKMLDEDPEIDGVLGYSEGATTAATLVLEEKRLFEEEGRPRHLKSAIFFAGWPPVAITKDGVKTLLSDECEEFIDLPSCHIVGCNDPYIHGAMALYSMCDEDTAILFDHGKGHTVPRDEQTILELAESIDRVFNMAK